MKIKLYKIYKPTKAAKSTNYNSHLLVQDPKLKEAYAKKLDSKNINLEEWESIVSAMKETAEEVLGIRKNTNVKLEEYDPEIELLVKKRKDLDIQLSNSSKVSEIIATRKEKNKICNWIKKKLKNLRNKHIDSIIADVENAPSDVQMYKSVKRLRKPVDNSKNIIVHDDDGKTIANKEEKYQAVKQHFKQKLYKEDAIMIDKFVGEPRPLQKPITGSEVDTMSKQMSNSKATGADEIPIEFIKYASDEFKEVIAKFLNNILETHTDSAKIGQSILLPLPKPGKTQGPRKNIRPINLLKAIRMLFSLITLKRIEKSINKYISNSQSAYRPGRSTADVVWAHRFMCAKPQVYQGLTIKIIGIDMSSAFDTTNRRSLMDVLEEILDDDELRLCRLLLAESTIEIKFDNHQLEVVVTNIGSPQGDGISGTFFNIELEHALRKLRTKMEEWRSNNYVDPYEKIRHLHPNLTEPKNRPDEAIYADDTDFWQENNEEAEHLVKIVKPILKEKDLNVNDDKTEYTTIERKKTTLEEKDWRETKKLGSLLGDTEDMENRIKLSWAAMSQMKKLWKGKKVSTKRKIKLYKSLVKPILTYNFGTWGLTKAEEETLNRVHRKQLRILGRWFGTSNKKLYELCNEKELSTEMKKARWRLFGHVLRLPLDAPCQKAMTWYFEVPLYPTKFKGRARTTLPTTLCEDIKSRKGKLPFTQFRTLADLDMLRSIASMKETWKKVVDVM